MYEQSLISPASLEEISRKRRFELPQALGYVPIFQGRFARASVPLLRRRSNPPKIHRKPAGKHLLADSIVLGTSGPFERADLVLLARRIIRTRSGGKVAPVAKPPPHGSNLFFFRYRWACLQGARGRGNPRRTRTTRASAHHFVRENRRTFFAGNDLPKTPGRNVSSKAG